jgi:hypothetical protein
LVDAAGAVAEVVFLGLELECFVEPPVGGFFLAEAVAGALTGVAGAATGAAEAAGALGVAAGAVVADDVRWLVMTVGICLAPGY